MSKSSTGLRIAVDIGGTFTDTVLMNASRHVVATSKTLTTHTDPAEGALAGVRLAIDEAGIALADIEGFIHGTTLATNALIERRGATVSTITTGGFRDILEIAYERRYNQYDIDIDKPDLIVPRTRCFTIDERSDVTGEIVNPLDESAVDRLVCDLKAVGTEAVAICFLHSYANPTHEQRLAELIGERLPGVAITLSSGVSPEAREFERLCTTIANAFIQPLMARYLKSFARTFAAEGLTCPILMMTAGGGMTTLETASLYPVRLVESGPAGGAVLAANAAEQCGLPEVLSFDMGGTTAKLCLIDNYMPQTSRRFEIARAQRFIKGSGMPVRIPVVEMIEIGAGGGSIAHVDRLGRLNVGPESAGSEPGPAAFGQGGVRPTVTDADVVMGLIEPSVFAEGRLSVDIDKARVAVDADVGENLGLAIGAAANGISQIVDENMAAAARMHSVESGKVLGQRTMIAFGGNGPLHATRVARKAGVGRILIPQAPGVGSAVGFLFAPISFEIVQSRYTMLDGVDLEGLNTLFGTLIDEAETVVRAGAPSGALSCRRSAFMRYRGQGHEFEIDLPDRPLSARDIPTLRVAFEKEYSRQFSRAVPRMEIEILNWAVRVSTARIPPVPLVDIPSPRDALPESRHTIICDLTGETVEAGIFERKSLCPGDRVAGPALIVEPQTTTLVSRDFKAFIDGGHNIVLISTSRPEAHIS
ncbi:MAG: hydantoinase/oxoprolinase family protein [Alphaproteobacteria bacterium]